MHVTTASFCFELPGESLVHLIHDLTYTHICDKLVMCIIY